MTYSFQTWTMLNAKHNRQNPHRYDRLHFVHLLENNANWSCIQINLHDITHQYFSPVISVSIRQYVFTDPFCSFSAPIFSLSLLHNQPIFEVRLHFCLEDGSRNSLRNLCTYLPIYINGGNQRFIEYSEFVLYL